MFLAFITAAIRRAVLQGFREAVDELELASEPKTSPDPLAVLQERMRPALEDKSEPESKARKSAK